MTSSVHLGLKTAFGEAIGQLEEGAITGASRDQLSSLSLSAGRPCVDHGCFIGQWENNQSETGHGSDFPTESGTGKQTAQEQPPCVAASAGKDSRSWTLVKGGGCDYGDEACQLGK